MNIKIEMAKSVETNTQSFTSHSYGTEKMGELRGMQTVKVDFIGVQSEIDSMKN